MVPKALCDGEKKSKMGGVFQGESIYESNLKHDRPRADFKNRNSKRGTNKKYGYWWNFPKLIYAEQKRFQAELRQAEAIPFF